MGGATREFYFEVLDDALRILTEHADHLVIGGTATKVLLGQELGPDEDLDVLIRPDDAERLLDAFGTRGYSTCHRDENWVYKAGRPDVTIDLIFRAAETILMDDRHLEKSLTRDVHGLTLRVPAVEDLVVMKAAFDGSERPGRMYDALTLMAAHPIDWGYLVERACTHAPRRMLGFLLYAADDGVAVPQELLTQLSTRVIPADGRVK